ncbi:hypothetical protein AC1031_018217 [Aphanomyces cochlioides]|nr:hypothetical protein AC1031_018217 [Aphanomyces cochlioides]
MTTLLVLELTGAIVAGGHSKGYPLAWLRYNGEERMAQGEWTSDGQASWTDDQRAVTFPKLDTVSPMEFIFSVIEPHRATYIGSQTIQLQEGEHHLDLPNGTLHVKMRVEAKKEIDEGGFSIKWTASDALKLEQARKAEQNKLIQAELSAMICEAKDRQAKRALYLKEKEDRRKFVAAVIQLQARWRGIRVRMTLPLIRQQVECERRKSLAKKNVRERARRRHETEIQSLQTATHKSLHPKQNQTAKVPISSKTEIKPVEAPERLIDDELIHAIRLVHGSKWANSKQMQST